MGLRINNNIAAQNAYRNLSVSDSQMSKSLE
jgi:flagellin